MVTLHRDRWHCRVTEAVPDAAVAEDPALHLAPDSVDNSADDMEDDEMSTTTQTPFANLIVWLDDHEVPYELHEHPIAYTAEATAHAEGVDPRTFAKSVGIRSSEGSTVLAVVHATDEVDLARLAAFLDVDWVAVLSEEELATILPDCEVGTIPPIPEVAGVAVYADEAVRADDEISFHAGSHRVAVRVRREAWERAAGIRYGAFARPKH